MADVDHRWDRRVFLHYLLLPVDGFLLIPAVLARHVLAQEAGDSERFDLTYWMRLVIVGL